MKVGDLVRVICGKDKGRTGKIMRYIDDKVQVDGMNIQVKHSKSGIITKAGFIHASNVALYDGSRTSRIGVRQEAGRNVRFYKTTGGLVPESVSKSSKKEQLS